MKKILLLFFLVKIITAAHAEAPHIALEKVHGDINHIESIKRGAKFFSTVCMACHTMVYLRYNHLAKSAGVRYEKMPLQVTSWPNGIKPPDLSLEIDIRGADWVYTYLHSFYVDKKKPTGFNNLVYPDTAMPNVLAPFQGTQILQKEIKLNQGIFTHEPEWYDMLVLQHQGSMTPGQFDDLLKDVVNFLNYAANPYQQAQHRLGLWVLGFLGILFILLYLLKHEYWKDIKRNSE